MENESDVVQEVDRCVKCGDSKGVDANGLCLSDNCLKVACRCVFPSTSVSADNAAMFADCRDGNHGECLYQWPDPSNPELLITCGCPCHTSVSEVEDKNSVSGASDCSQIVIEKDNLLDADSPFRAGTGLMGATDTGQRVTKHNAHFLPSGSVVRLDDGNGVLIHLHDGLWYWNSGCAWCYDTLDRHKSRLPGTLCHLPLEKPSTSDVFNNPERDQHSPASLPKSESLNARCRRVWVCKRCGNCLDHCKHGDESNFHEDLTVPCSVRVGESESVVTVDEACKWCKDRIAGNLVSVDEAARRITVKLADYAYQRRLIHCLPDNDVVARIIITELSADANEAAELKQAVRDYFNIDPAENAAEWCAASSNLLRLVGLPVDHAPAPVVGVDGCLMADCTETQASFCISHVLEVHCPNAKRLQFLEDQFRITDSKRVTESCNAHGPDVAVFYCGAECPLCKALDTLAASPVPAGDRCTCGHRCPTQYERETEEAECVHAPHCELMRSAYAAATSDVDKDDQEGDLK